MASSSTRKPPLASNLNRRSQPSSGLPGPGRNDRSPTPSSSTGTGAREFLSRRNTMREGSLHSSRNSISSPLSARSAAKRSPDASNEAELENAALLEDLRSRLAKSESAAEAAADEYTKQIKALQLRLDESSSEQAKMEEAMHAREEVVENLEMQIKDLTRTKRDQENIYEAERIAAQQEKEELLDREEELNTIVQRLKDALSQRERSPDRDGQSSIDTASVDESAGFAPSTHGVNSNNNLVLQKDKLIESLRLELAEAQIRLAEADHLGGTKLQQLEQQLLETRMTNARLMEDNESFQLLLSSAALNGDFPRGDYLTSAFSDTEAEIEPSVAKKVQGSPRNSVSGLGSNLAEELEEADKEESERYRKLEAEIKALKDQNKAMSLYINNIIERILQHKDSEAILDKTAPSEKPLPSPPKEDDQSSGLLQRTKSLAMRRTQPKHTHSENNNIQRSQSVRAAPGGAHKRSQSDATAVYSGNNSLRNEGVPTPRGGSFFGNAQSDNYTSRRPRDSNASVDSGVSDINTNVSGEISLPSSPPPTGATMGIGGNKLRPLRLVQENVGSGMMSPPLGGRKISGEHTNDEDEKTKLERRQSKRSSWMGWFNRGKDEEAPNTSILENVVPEKKEVE